jgi:hypothetical protein
MGMLGHRPLLNLAPAAMLLKLNRRWYQSHKFTSGLLNIELRDAAPTCSFRWPKAGCSDGWKPLLATVTYAVTYCLEFQISG